MTWANRNQAWAEVLIDELVRSGVEHATLAPGSRSTPLVLALADHDAVTVHTHLDERSSAFFALGIGKATGRPAVVVTTSGTAAVNLHPAIVEAHQAQVPLLALTADRPRRLRGTGANQTIDQVHLYGSAVRAFHDLPGPEVTAPALLGLRGLACRAYAAAVGPPAGPVHLNVPFEKPLEPTPVEGDVPDRFHTTHPVAAGGRPQGAPYTRHHASPPSPDQPIFEELVDRVREAARGLIVAGPSPRAAQLGRGVLALAEATGFPVIADPLSGCRFHPQAPGQVVGGYDLFLRDPELAQALAPELILRVGGPPTSKHLTTYLGTHRETAQVLIDPAGTARDPPGTASTHVVADPAVTTQRLATEVTAEGTGPVVDHGWQGAWQEAEAATQGVLDDELVRDPFEGTVLRALAAALPEHGQLLVSNSMPVRDLDAYGAPRGPTLATHGNRGASGIDGVTSTAAGIAATAGPTTAVVGDLAFLHDANGLQVLADEGLPLVLVVLNNDGGGIFHHLPIREHDPHFTRHFATPHGRDLSKASALHGLEHRAVKAPSQVAKQVEAALNDGGPLVLEVACDREENHRRHREVARAVQETVPHPS